MKYYVVYEMFGNFSHMVYVADNFNAIQDYLDTAFYDSQCDDEELFCSYYSIEEF